MRNDAVIEADDEDRAEFESFCGVKREQCGRVDICDRILVGNEGDILEKFLQRACGLFEGKTFQFLHVLPALYAFF